MLSANKKITLRQLQMLMTLEVFGTSVIVLPRRAAVYAAQDGWLIAGGLAVFGLLYGALITSVARRFPSESFVTYTGRLLSKPVAFVLGAGLLVKLILCAGLELRLFSIILRETMLHNTPLAVTGSVMLVVAAYAAYHGIETRARLGELLFFIVLTPLIVLLGLALFNTDFTHLLPMFEAQPSKILSGTLRLGFIFTGLEGCFFIFPFLHKPSEGRKAVLQGLTVIGLSVVVIVLATIARFGPADVTRIAWPVLKMMDMAKIPGSFVERQDALIMSFWILASFSILNAALFYGGVLLRDLARCISPFGVSDKKIGSVDVWICAAAVFLFFVIPRGIDDIFALMDGIFKSLGFFYLAVVPLVLWLAIRIRANRTPRTDRKSHKVAIFMMTLFLCLLSGCWDRVEIENRSFAVAIGIDKAEGRDAFTVTLAVPDTSKSADNAQSGSRLQTADGDTVTEAIKKMDAQSGKALYLGQCKTILLSEALLADQNLLRQAMDTLARYNIDRKAVVLASGDALDQVLDTQPPGEASAPLFISDFYRDGHKAMGRTFRKDFESLLSDLYAEGSSLVPRIEIDETALRLTGAAAVAEHAFAGLLDETETRGYLWSQKNLCKNAVVVLGNDECPVQITVSSNKVEWRFISLPDGRLQCMMHVHVTGTSDTTLSQDSVAQFEAIIADEITAASDKMTSLGLDGFHVAKMLYRKHKTVAMYGAGITIEPKVTVVVRQSDAIQ